MKKLLLAILATTALAACSDHSIEATPNVAIEFGDLKTRAIVENVQTIQDDENGFGVSAIMNLGADGTPEADQYIDLLEKEQVKYVNGAWSYDNTRYWVNDRTFHFFAYYPYNLNIEKAQLTATYDGWKIRFDTPETADDSFLIAYRTESISSNINVYPTVDFTFKHQLSKVNFAIHMSDAQNPDIEKMRVTGVTISGIKKSGTLSTSRFVDYSDTWDFDNTALNFSEEYTENNELNQKGQAVTPFKVFVEGLYLIPQQPISGDQIQITINYQYGLKKTNDDQTETWTWSNREVSKFLPTSTKWAASTSILYNLTLSEDNNITFSTPTVESWGTEQSGGTIIIK